MLARGRLHVVPVATVRSWITSSPPLGSLPSARRPVSVSPYYGHLQGFVLHRLAHSLQCHGGYVSTDSGQRLLSRVAQQTVFYAAEAGQSSFSVRMDVQSMDGGDAGSLNPKCSAISMHRFHWLMWRNTWVKSSVRTTTTTTTISRSELKVARVVCAGDAFFFGTLAASHDGCKAAQGATTSFSLAV